MCFVLGPIRWCNYHNNIIVYYDIDHLYNTLYFTAQILTDLIILYEDNDERGSITFPM